MCVGNSRTMILWCCDWIYSYTSHPHPAEESKLQNPSRFRANRLKSCPKFSLKRVRFSQCDIRSRLFAQCRFPSWNFREVFEESCLIFLSFFHNLQDKFHFPPSSCLSICSFISNLTHSDFIIFFPPSVIRDNMRATWFFSHVATELSTFDCMVVWVSGSVIGVSFSSAGKKKKKIWNCSPAHVKQMSLFSSFLPSLYHRRLGHTSVHGESKVKRVCNEECSRFQFTCPVNARTLLRGLSCSHWFK